MSILHRKLLREVRQSPGLLAATAAIVAVGAACLVCIRGAYADLEAARAAFYRRCRMPDFWIELRKAPVAELERRAVVPGVAEVRDRLSFAVRVDLESAGRPVSGKVLSLPAERGPVLSDVVVRRGSWFTGDGHDQVIVSEKFAEAHGLGPGSRLPLVLHGRRRELLVVGTAIDAEHVYLLPPGGLAPDPGGFGVFFLARPFAEEAFDHEGAANSLVGRLSPEARERPAPVLDALSERLAPYGVVSAMPRADQPSHLALRSEMEGLETFAVFLPAVFLGVAALVLDVQVRRLTERQRTIVGTLSALGRTRTEIIGHYAGFGAVVGVAGGIPGGALGLWIERGIVVLYRRFFQFPGLEAGFHPGLLAAATAISVVFAALGAWGGARRVLRLPVAQALRPAAPPSARPVPLERWTVPWKRLGFSWRMALRSVFRERRRTVVGLVASALGTSIVLLALGSRDSFERLLELHFDNVMRADYELVLRDELGEDALLEARRLPGVVRAEPVLSVPCRFVHGNRRKRGGVTGVAPGARLTVPVDDAGRPVPVPSSGFVLARRLAEELGVRPGDPLAFEWLDGERTRHIGRVQGTVESSVGLSVYADRGWLAETIGEREAVSSIRLATRSGFDARRELLRALRDDPEVQFVQVIQEEKRRLEREFIDQMLVNAAILVGFAGVILFGSIFSGSLVALEERRRQVATLRALGYYESEVAGIFLRESVLVHLMGALPGLALGYGMLCAMAEAFETDILTMPVSVRPATWAITLGLAALFSVAAALAVRREVGRLDWRAALREGE